MTDIELKWQPDWEHNYLHCMKICHLLQHMKIDYITVSERNIFLLNYLMELSKENKYFAQEIPLFFLHGQKQSVVVSDCIQCWKNKSFLILWYNYLWKLAATKSKVARTTRSRDITWNLMLKDIIHQTGKNRKCDNKTKGHNQIFTMTCGTNKCNLPLISHSHSNKVVCITEVELSKNLSSKQKL